MMMSLMPWSVYKLYMFATHSQEKKGKSNSHTHGSVNLKKQKNRTIQLSLMDTTDMELKRDWWVCKEIFCKIIIFRMSKMIFYEEPSKYLLQIWTKSIL